MAGREGRDLRDQVDRFGHIAVAVVIGGSAGAETRETGVSARPEAVVRFLRELADDVERLAVGSDCGH